MHCCCGGGNPRPGHEASRDRVTVTGVPADSPRRLALIAGWRAVGGAGEASPPGSVAAVGGVCSGLPACRLCVGDSPVRRAIAGQRLPMNGADIIEDDDASPVFARYLCACAAIDMSYVKSGSSNCPHTGDAQRLLPRAGEARRVGDLSDSPAKT